MAHETESGGMNGLLVGFVIGAVVGTTIGLLYAPKSGRETRAMIRERYNDFRDRAGEMASTARERAKEFAGRFRRGESDQEEEMQGA